MIKVRLKFVYFVDDFLVNRNAKMGHGFGHLWKYYGMISYTISPFEQKALKGVINPGFLNTCRRIAENVPYMAPRKFLSKERITISI